MAPKPTNRSIYIPAKDVALLQEVEQMCRDLGTNLSAAVVEALRLWKEAHARSHLLAAIERERGRLRELGARRVAGHGKALDREKAEVEAHLEELTSRLRYLEALTPEPERLAALGQALLGLAVKRCPRELANLLAVSQPRRVGGRPASPEAEAQIYDL